MDPTRAPCSLRILLKRHRSLALVLLPTFVSISSHSPRTAWHQIPMAQEGSTTPVNETPEDRSANTANQTKGDSNVNAFNDRISSKF